jgi:IS30 family transposase
MLHALAEPIDLMAFTGLGCVSRWATAQPCACWERGANENRYGLIRQFFPNDMRFDSITKKDITFTMNRRIHRARRCFGFKTHYKVFMKQQLHSRQIVVALQT